MSAGFQIISVNLLVTRSFSLVDGVVGHNVGQSSVLLNQVVGQSETRLSRDVLIYISLGTLLGYQYFGFIS